MDGGGSWKVGIYGPYISQNTYPISRLSYLNADRSVIRLFLTPEKKVSPKRQKPSEAIKMIKYKVLHCTDNPNSIKGSKIKNKKGRRRNKISAIK